MAGALLVGVTGVALAESDGGSAAELGRHAVVEWPGSTPGRVLEQRLVVHAAERQNFWATHFGLTADPAPIAGAGGYIGVQTDGAGGPRAAIFSFWGGTTWTVGGCSTWVGGPEGGEGVSCPAAFPWTTGATITVRVTRTGTGRGPDRVNSPRLVDGTYWTGTIASGGSSATLGTIFVPGVQHRIRPDYNFDEDFSPGNGHPACLHSGYQTSNVWFTPTTIDDAGNSSPGGSPASSGINVCPARSQVFDDRVVLDRGPEVLPAATGSSPQFVGDAQSGWLYILGRVDINFPHAIGVTSTVNGSATPYNAVSSAGPGARQYRVLVAKIPRTRKGATFCAVAENGPKSGLGCLQVLSGTVSAAGDAMTGNEGIGTISGTVTRGSSPLVTSVRTRVGAVVGTPVSSRADGRYVAPFAGAPVGATICVEAREHNVWVELGCRAINSGTLDSASTTKVRGRVNNTGFPGPLGVRAYVNGVYRAWNYSDPGPGSRSYSIDIAATPGSRVCVKADSYGHHVTLGCRTV
jgi:hypothetical protein